MEAVGREDPMERPSDQERHGQSHALRRVCPSTRSFAGRCSRQLEQVCSKSNRDIAKDRVATLRRCRNMLRAHPQRPFLCNVAQRARRATSLGDLRQFPQGRGCSIQLASDKTIAIANRFGHTGPFFVRGLGLRACMQNEQNPGCTECLHSR